MLLLYSPLLCLVFTLQTTSFRFECLQHFSQDHSITCVVFALFCCYDDIKFGVGCLCVVFLRSFLRKTGITYFFSEDAFVFLEHVGALLLERIHPPASPDFATLPNLNAVKFLAKRDNLVINPIIRLLSSRAIQNISDMLGYV